MSRGDVLDLSIEKIIFGGDGLGRIGEGFVIFVPFVAAGDRVRVRITEKKAHHARGEVIELLELAASREKPPCPYYERCGGCQYQHLTYAEECRLKEQQVREALIRGGKIAEPKVLPIIASPLAYGYRNRLTVHSSGGRIGFHNVNGRELVDIRVCLLGREAVNQELTRLRASQPGDGHYSLRDPSVPPSGFFQANHELHGALREVVAAALPEKSDLLLEGYCGGGFFTGMAAPRFDQVVAVDNDPRTLIDARRLGLTNVEWHEGDAALIFPEVLRNIEGRPTTVLLDPPRQGLPIRLVEALTLDPVLRLIYVSCDPATLARDARMLSTSYVLTSVQPIDLFPRTAQIECVSIWTRK